MTLKKKWSSPLLILVPILLLAACNPSASGPADVGPTLTAAAGGLENHVPTIASPETETPAVAASTSEPDPTAAQESDDDPEPSPTLVTEVPSVTTNTSVNIRSGPGTYYPVYFVSPPDTTYEVFGVSPDSFWWGVLVSQDVVDDGEGWIFVDLAVANESAGQVPVVQPPPVPETQPPVAPDPGPNPTPTTDAAPVMGTITEIVRVYSGPGKEYDSYGKVPPGISTTALGRSQDGLWIVLALPDIAPDGRGWVNANYVFLLPAGGNLPIVPAP